ARGRRKSAVGYWIRLWRTTVLTAASGGQCGAPARSEDRGHLDAEGIRVAARERRSEEELRVRLHDQPRRDGQLVGDLEDGLAVSDRRSGHRLVLLEILGEAGHGNRGAEDVLPA